MASEFRDQLIALLPRLRRFALALCGERETADDLVQTACVKALASAQQWQPGTRLDSWMYKIMQNHWIDQRRAVNASGGDLLPLDEPDELPGEISFEQQVHAQMDLAQVLRALQGLPEAQRGLLALVSIEGLSYREAAAVLELPIGTVMSRLCRARNALRQLLNLESQHAPEQAQEVAA